MHTSKRGFISLIFVLGVSATLMTWIGLSSAQVFDFIRADKTYKNDLAHTEELITCADAVIDKEVREGLFSHDAGYSMVRNLYLDDVVSCSVTDRQVTVLASGEFTLQFNVHIDSSTSPFISIFTYIKNGFVISTQSKFHNN